MLSVCPSVPPSTPPPPPPRPSVCPPKAPSVPPPAPDSGGGGGNWGGEGGVAGLGGLCPAPPFSHPLGRKKAGPEIGFFRPKNNAAFLLRRGGEGGPSLGGLDRAPAPELPPQHPKFPSSPIPMIVQHPKSCIIRSTPNPPAPKIPQCLCSTPISITPSTPNPQHPHPRDPAAPQILHQP